MAVFFVNIDFFKFAFMENRNAKNEIMKLISLKPWLIICLFSLGFLSLLLILIDTSNPTLTFKNELIRYACYIGLWGFLIIVFNIGKRRVLISILLPGLFTLFVFYYSFFAGLWSLFDGNKPSSTLYNNKVNSSRLKEITYSFDYTDNMDVDYIINYEIENDFLLFFNQTQQIDSSDIKWSQWKKVPFHSR